MTYKKNILQLLFVIYILFFQSCDPFPPYDRYRGHWKVKNSTSDTLNIWCSITYITGEKHYVTILPDSIEEFFSPFDKGMGIGNSPSDATFESFYAYNTEKEDSVTVSSLTHKTLKVWKESDQNSSVKQFFKESSWSKKEWKTEDLKAGEYTHYEWTFEILPEDIAP